MAAPDDRGLRPVRPLHIGYGEPLDSEISSLEGEVRLLDLPSTLSPRWTAIKLLEGDRRARATVLGAPGGAAVVRASEESSGRVRAATGEDAAWLVADRRFAWAHRLSGTAVTREVELRSRTERLDDVLTSRWLGVPIFLVLMWWVFTLVTDVAGPYVGWVGGVVAGPVSSLAGAGMDAVGLGDTWLRPLLVDGVIAGVGSVLVFIPVLAVLYVALGLLEDSGYMARAAFLMDRVMRPIGLTGKSFLPLLLGFGCNVPGVYATRVLDRRRDRILTALLMPFVSCAARLPIYILLGSVFFPAARGNVVFVMYLASIAVVLLVGALADRVLMRGERSDSFVLELPPYRRPSARVLWSYVSQRVRAFVGKAGTVIFACAMAVWFLLAIPVAGSGSFADTPMQDSGFASVAGAVAPVLAPAGLDSWQSTGTLLSGFVAKEVVVSTFEQTYGGAGPDDDGGPGGLGGLTDSATGFVSASRDALLAVPGVVGIDLVGAGSGDEVDIAAPLRAGFDRSSGGHGGLAAAAFLAFVLLYVPCMATVAAIRQEIGGRWAAVSVGLNLAVAWLAAVAVFQVGRALGLG